ncbi:SH3 domain-containing protein [Paralimibaculum aggregatum]|nr:SH3 domain-containing protein [Limibaculum sp. NKW23]
MPVFRDPRVRRLLCCSVLALAVGAEAASAQGLLGRLVPQDETGQPAQPADPYGAADDDAFRAIDGAQDPAQLRRFVSRYPDSPYVGKAEAQLASLEAAAETRAAAEACTSRWPRVSQSCTLSEIEGFIAQCGDDPNIRKAKLRLKGIGIGMHCKGEPGAAGASQQAAVGPATGSAQPPEPAPAPAPKGGETAPAPAAKPAPAPASAADSFGTLAHSGTYYVNQNSNVRSGPGTSHSRVGGVTVGTKIEATGKVDGWVRFTHEGRPAFIYANLLQTSPVTTPRVASRPKPSAEGGEVYQYRKPKEVPKPRAQAGGSSKVYQYRAPKQAPQSKSGGGFSFKDLLKNSNKGFEPSNPGD